jgi:glycosyltransferase involved in cell wall biosynthesis
MISVVMPAYNVEEHIEAAILSVLSQTYRDFELIVVDDGSTDRSADIADKIADSRLRLIRQENQGVAVARNRGLAEAAGEYVTFLDADDLWKPEFLTRMVAVAEEKSVPFVYCGHSTLRENGREEHHQQIYLEGNVLSRWIGSSIPLNMCSVLVRRQFLEDAGISFTPGCLVGEDSEFFTKIFCLTPVAAVPEKLMIYRHRSGSAVHSSWNERNLHHLYALERSEAFIAENYRGGDRAEVFRQMKEHVDYYCYRLCLQAIRHEHYEVLHAILARREIEFAGKYRTLRNRLRWAIIKSEVKWLWKLL